MYTGIVQGLEKILDIRQGEGFITLVISNDRDFFHDVFIFKIYHSTNIHFNFRLIECNVKTSV